jgi:hypothetical protein
MKRLAPVILLSLVGSAAATAEEVPIEFALHLSTHKTELDYNGSPTDTKTRRIGVGWQERHWERLQIGVIAGFSRVTQTNNAATAGMDLDGWHLGFNVNVDLYRTPRFYAYAAATYVYQDVEGADGSDKVGLSWDEPSARVGAAFAVGNNVWLHTALRHGKIEAEQQRTGSVNETLRVTRSTKTGGRIGLQLQLDDRDFIEIFAESGFNRGVVVYLGHRY